MSDKTDILRMAVNDAIVREQCDDTDESKAVTDAAITAYGDRREAEGRVDALFEVEELHDCCTTGCGAVAFDGADEGFCPTCLLTQRLRAIMQSGIAK